MEITHCVAVQYPGDVGIGCRILLVAQGCGDVAALPPHAGILDDLGVGFLERMPKVGVIRPVRPLASRLVVAVSHNEWLVVVLRAEEKRCVPELLQHDVAL